VVFLSWKTVKGRKVRPGIKVDPLITELVWVARDVAEIPGKEGDVEDGDGDRGPLLRRLYQFLVSPTRSDCNDRRIYDPRIVYGDVNYYAKRSESWMQLSAQRMLKAAVS